MIFDVGSTGVGNRWFAKSFCRTESVCLGRTPVCRTADRPRFLLLSAFHSDGEVEKRARGVRDVHWAEPAKKEKAVSQGTEDNEGRRNRDVGMAMVQG